MAERDTGWVGFGSRQAKLSSSWRLDPKAAAGELIGQMPAIDAGQIRFATGMRRQQISCTIPQGSGPRPPRRPPLKRQSRVGGDQVESCLRLWVLRAAFFAIDEQQPAGWKVLNSSIGNKLSLVCPAGRLGCVDLSDKLRPVTPATITELRHLHSHQNLVHLPSIRCLQKLDYG